MTPDTATVKLSPLDTQRWKVVTAKTASMSADALPGVLTFCQANAVKLLIARCPTQDLPAVHAMESAGFQLMDTLVYFVRKLGADLPADTGAVPIRDIRAGEEAAVKQVASATFKGYSGHYHADPRLDRQQCDETYTDWAYQSCLSKAVADGVLVAELKGAIVGFATLRLNSEEEGEGVLFGVAPEAQGHGIYRSFMVRGMEWCRARNRKTMVVSTQVTNIAVQKVWTRLGFEPSKSFYTFHKWF
jgi:GNAT superfamily N-acetyltransferase